MNAIHITLFIVTFNKLPHYYCSVSFFITYFLSSFHFFSRFSRLKCEQSQTKMSTTCSKCRECKFFVSSHTKMKWYDSFFYIFHISHSLSSDKFIVIRWTKRKKRKKDIFNVWTQIQNKCEMKIFANHDILYNTHIRLKNIIFCWGDNLIFNAPTNVKMFSTHQKMDNKNFIYLSLS